MNTRHESTHHREPAAGRGGWSRQPSRAWDVFSLAIAGLLVGAAAFAILVACHP